MPSSPAFQFYPDDFMGGRPGMMTPDETHCYVWLLCLDWNQGGFAYDEKRLAQWCRIPASRFRKAWGAVSECFTERDGRLYNPRLDKERAKQAAWREKSSAGGKAGAKKRWAEAKDGVTTPITTLTPPSIPNDDTPVSSLQSPVTTTATTCDADAPRLRRPRRKQPGQPASSRPSWLAPSAAVWEQAKGAGSFPWGKAGAALKPLHDAGHSGETIAGHLERYIPTAGEFVSFVRFRETFADYAPVALTGPAVVDGWMSDEVERLTRPAAAGGGR